MEPTSCFSMRPRNCVAFADSDSRYRRGPPERILSKASQAWPEPESPVMSVNRAGEVGELVRLLLRRRLIACGTLLPRARSLYRWQSKVADEREVVVLLKTRSARLDELQSAFGELHAYKVPEQLALPVSAGLTKY